MKKKRPKIRIVRFLWDSTAAGKKSVGHHMASVGRPVFFIPLAPPNPRAGPKLWGCLGVEACAGNLLAGLRRALKCWSSGPRRGLPTHQPFQPGEQAILPHPAQRHQQTTRRRFPPSPQRKPNAHSCREVTLSSEAPPPRALRLSVESPSSSQWSRSNRASISRWRMHKGKRKKE